MYEVTISGPPDTLGQVRDEFAEELSQDQTQHRFGAEPDTAFTILFSDDPNDVVARAEPFGWRLRMHAKAVGPAWPVGGDC